MESIWIPLWRQSPTINTTRRIIQRSIRILERTRSLYSLWKKHTGMEFEWWLMQYSITVEASLFRGVMYRNMEKSRSMQIGLWWTIGAILRKKQIHGMKDFILSHSSTICQNSIQTTKKWFNISVGSVKIGLKNLMLMESDLMWEMKFHTGF